MVFGDLTGIRAGLRNLTDPCGDGGDGGDGACGGARHHDPCGPSLHHPWHSTQLAVVSASLRLKLETMTFLLPRCGPGLQCPWRRIKLAACDTGSPADGMIP